MDRTTDDAGPHGAATLQHASDPAADALFAGPGEMRARCRALEWSATPLGPVEAWPLSLRTSAATVLGSGFPCILLWGPELIQIYNDGYATIIGAKHPRALGRGNAEVWPEVWHINGPIFDRVRGGETVTVRDQLYPLLRRGTDAPPEDVYLTVSYAPVPDESGAIGGAFLTLFDTTAQVLAARAQRELTAELEARNAQLADQTVALEFTAQQLEDNASALEAQTTELAATASALEARTREAEDAAAALRASEARLRDVFEQAPVAVAVMVGPDHVFSVVSPRYQQTPGLGRPLLGRSVREAFPEVAAQGYLDAMDRVYATGEPFFAGERRVMLRVEGKAELEEHFFNIGYQPLRDGAGAIYGIASVAHDVTEQVLARREAEAARAEAEAGRERLDAVLAQLPLGVVIVEAPSGRVIVINDAVARIWRQRRATSAVEQYSDEWIGYHPDGRRVESHEWPIARAARHGETVSETVIEIERHDGKRALIEVSASPVRDAAGTVTAAVAVFTDITARVQAERERERLVRELEVERARLADVFRQAPTFLAVVRGPDFVFELVNDAYYQLVGHRELVGKPVLEALPEVRDQGFVELLRDVVATGVPFIGRELAVALARTPDLPPEERYLDFVYQPLTEADGTRSGVVAHGTDVTEQVLARREVERLLGESERARAEAEQARAEADAASRAKSEFLATMSHEIRTPINAIQGYAQLLDLGLGGAVTPQQRDYLGRLTTSSQHLLGLINDVLDLSKVEAGELAVARESAVTGRAIAAALDLIGPQAATRGVRLVESERGAAGPAYVGDEHRVRQVLVNLLSNAVKFTEPGGTVTISSGSADTTPPDAMVEAGGPWTFVRVEDTGVGITPELHAAVFEPFMQVESGHTRTKGGTGLGLAISRRLARLMGGDLTLRSVPGEGSTFTLWLPGADHVHTGWTAEMTAAQVAGARTSEVAARSLGDLGEVLRAELDAILNSYVERMRRDPGTPLARGMDRGALEDHAVTLLADLAQSLVIAGEAGADAVGILRDGSGIQRVISEHHGARRHSQGWTLAALRRDYQILLEELDRAVRARRSAAPAGGAADSGAGALRMLVGLVERAAQASVRAWRRAADAEGGAAPGAGSGGGRSPG